MAFDPSHLSGLHLYNFVNVCRHDDQADNMTDYSMTCG